MTENKNRCVITGLGLISAIGNNVNECWENAVKGVCGIKELTSVSTEGCYANIGAEVRADDLDTPATAKDMDRVSKLCVKASGEAIADARLDLSAENKTRVGVIMGSCVGGVVSIEHYYKNGECAEDVKKMPISAIANHVAETYGAGGVVTNVANACAAGTISIAYACDLIRSGVGDVFIAGGADAFASVPYAGFLALHALDTQPCGPFNRSSGITLGEGSGAVIVESYEHAVARGAKIYCEVLGSGVSSDAHHITAPRPDGDGQMHAIRRAMENSGVAPSEIGYINAHGTGTNKNDEAEFLSLHTLFDEKGGDLSVSSTKAMVGHCLGAAGAIEAVFAVKALTENVIPPTIGYTEEGLATLAEKAGKIDFVPNVAREKELVTVMSNSFAFGGNNASIVFSKEQGNVEIPEKKEKVYITGVGLVTPAGNTVEEYAAAWAEGNRPESASTDATVGTDDYARCGLKMAFYRKLDKFSQLQAVSGMQALADAGITITPENAADIGLIVGTADGPLATVCAFEKDIAEKGNAAGSAFQFPNTVYNAAGGYLSICAGIRGYNVTVTAGAQAGLAGVCYAKTVLDLGEEKIMLATGTDENCEIIDALYTKIGAKADGVNALYNGKDAGFVLGGGSTAIVTETASSAGERGAVKLAEVAGCGMAHESVAVGTLAGSEGALREAIALALADAGVAAGDVDAVFGFGNGQAETDNIEASVHGALFADKPLVSVRHMTGEARSASAALSCAHAALTLGGKITGEQTAYVMKGGSMEKTAIDLKDAKTVLVTAAGIGGSYTAVVLKKA